jgi:hypothetical protein
VTVTVTRVAALVRTHWLFCLVLLAGVVVRAAVQWTFWPALFYVGDSFGYIDAAYGHFLVGFDAAHPSGYPLIIEVLGIPGRKLATIAVTQHLAGLATGVLVYALLVRLDVNRVLAAAAAAVPLLTTYQVVLEQHVMPEAFFSLALTAAAFLTVGWSSRRPTVAAGFLTGFAPLLRPVGLLLAPVWLAYVVWKRRARLTIAAGTLALAVPILAFSTAHAIAGRGFGLSQWDGWVLYGRVAAIADCRGVDLPEGTRPLCESAAQRKAHERAGWTPSMYVFSPESPAHRLFGPAVTVEANPELRAFARAIIEAHPLTYTRTVLEDTAWFFRPGAGDRGLDPGVFLHEQDDDLSFLQSERVVALFFPDYSLSFRGPLHATVWYDRHLRPPRLLFGLLLLLPALSFVLAAAGRRRIALPHAAESTFLGAQALALLLGAVAFAEFNMRFLVPALPLLASGGALALADLAAAGREWARRWRARRIPVAEG